MRHAPPVLFPLALAAVLPAQEAVLAAAETGAVRAARAWQQAVAAQAERPDALARDFDVVYLGYDADGRPQLSEQHTFRDRWDSIALLWPRRSMHVPARPILANTLGQIFVGPVIDPGSGWTPTMASVTGEGVEVHLDNMLLQTGYAADGTLWRRVDEEPGLRPRRQRVRVEGLADGSAVCTAVEIGASRFAWHPGWLPVDDLDVVACHAGLRKQGANRWFAESDGVPARGLRLALLGCGFHVALRRDDVRVVDGELVVTVRDGAVASDGLLDDQAWVAEALRRLGQGELAMRAAASIDRDGDGFGEFGDFDAALPRADLLAAVKVHGLPAQQDRRLFRNHLFELHVAADPDGAEQGFVAYAWPDAMRSRSALAFFVDERGIVHACTANDRFGGHEHAPDRDARADATLGWRPLR